MKHRTGYLFKRGDNFYVAWRINGKAFSKALRDKDGNAITSKREAEEARTKLMAPFTVADEASALESIAGKLEGRKAELAKLDDEQHPALQVSAAWTEFRASPNRPDSGESTLRQYSFQWTAFADWVKKKLGDVVTLRDVTKRVAEEYASELTQGNLSASTFNKHINLLKLVFRVLKHKAKLVDNPWEEIKRRRVVSVGRRELTIEELRNVCQSAEGELRTLLALGVYTGMRLGDCATLRWGEVDLIQGVIRRIPNKTARRNPRPVVPPIHRELKNMLSQMPADERDDYVLPELATLYLKRTDLVTDIVQRHFRACKIKLHQPGTGTADKRAVVEVGFHSLRHTFVSLCRRSNAPLAVVESLVGHSSPAMTRHYTHVDELSAGHAVGLLPSIIGKDEPETVGDDLPIKIQKIAESMTGKNWKMKRDELLSLLAPEIK